MLKEIKTTIKICGISRTEYVVFYYKYLQLLLLFPKTISKNPSLFQNLSLWVVPSPLTMIQNQQEFQIQTNKVP